VITIVRLASKLHGAFAASDNSLDCYSESPSVSVCHRTVASSLSRWLYGAHRRRGAGKFTVWTIDGWALGYVGSAIPYFVSWCSGPRDRSGRHGACRRYDSTRWWWPRRLGCGLACAGCLSA